MVAVLDSLAALTFDVTPLEPLLCLAQNFYSAQGYALGSLALEPISRFSPLYLPIFKGRLLLPFFSGGRYWTRTSDPHNVDVMRYQLRQPPIFLFCFSRLIRNALAFSPDALPLSANAQWFAFPSAECQPPIILFCFSRLIRNALAFSSDALPLSANAQWFAFPSAECQPPKFNCIPATFST